MYWTKSESQTAQIKIKSDISIVIPHHDKFKPLFLLSFTFLNYTVGSKLNHMSKSNGDRPLQSISTIGEESPTKQVATELRQANSWRKREAGTRNREKSKKKNNK